MNKKTKPMTAEDLMKELASDPEYVAMKQEKERLRLERSEILLREQSPIVEDLRKVGVSVGNLGDLVMRAEPYPQAIPTLLHHLLSPYSDEIRDTIARSLAVPDARYAWPVIKAEYLKLPALGTYSAKDGLAAALGAIATEAVFDEVAEIVRDKSNGSTRIYLLRFLKRSKNPLAAPLLEELKSDPHLSKEIISWEKRKKRKK